MNQVSLVGVVERAWQRNGRTYARLRVRRSEYHPPKSDGPFDFVSVDLQRLVDPARLTGRTLEVVGLIGSRDIEVNLGSLVEDAAARKALGSAAGLMVKQVATEVVALHFAVLDAPLHSADGAAAANAGNAGNAAGGTPRKPLAKRKA